MEEQVLIHLLEANKELPSQPEILQRFKADYADRLELALASPEPVTAEAPASYREEPSSSVRFVDEAPSQEAAKPASESWEFAEDTNFEQQAAAQPTPEPVPETPAEQPADESLLSMAGQETEPAFEPAPSPISEQLTQPAFEPAAEHMVEFPESALSEAAPAEAAPAEAAPGEIPAYEQENTGDGEDIGLDDMMPVPEELARPETPDGALGGDAARKKKKKRR